MHVRSIECASDKFIVHMINLISNNNKATNAPDHPVFICIQVLLILRIKCRYFFEETF